MHRKEHPEAMNIDSPTQRKDYLFSFTGNASEYFRIWIVNVLLTILTLGIYSAWAKVRNNRYFYGNTILDGTSFEYTADPVKILKGRLIAVAVIIAYQLSGLYSLEAGLFAGLVLVLLLPLLIVLSMRFNMRYTTWRNIQFSFIPNIKRAYFLCGLPVALLSLVMVFAYQVSNVASELESLDAEATSQSSGMIMEFGANETMGSQSATLLDNSDVHSPNIIELAQIEHAASLELKQAEKTAITEKHKETLTGKLTTASLVMMVPIAIFWMLYPMFQQWYFAFLAQNTRYGKSKFSFIATSWKFYAVYFIALLFMLSIVLVGVLLGSIILSTSLIDENHYAYLAPIMMVIPMLAASAFIQTKKTNIIYSGLSCENIGFTMDLSVGRMLWLYLSNTIAILLSLGLMVPWAKIKMAKYRAEKTTLYASDFDSFHAKQNSGVDARASEITDLMDFDLGL